MSGRTVLEIKDLSKSFGKNKVLDGINLQVEEGTVCGLMGENGAGKSTMMKCLFGIYAKDEGQISLYGKPVDFKGPKEALESGVAMVHQELQQCLDRTVMDNLFLGRYPKKGGFVDEARMLRESNNLFARLKMNVNPQTVMRTMSVSQRQMVEIAKAVSYDAKLIVLDEPTSSLTEREVKKLFSIVDDLRKQGVSFVYISHKMDEVFEICDDVAVLRDGKMIFKKSTKETDMNELITAMVGRSLDKRFPDIDNKPGEEYLEVRDLTTKYEPVLHDISFKVRKGEIFGIYGLVGAGRSELLEAMFGIRTIASGQLLVGGKKMRFSSSKEAMAHSFALVTEVDLPPDVHTMRLYKTDRVVLLRKNHPLAKLDRPLKMDDLAQYGRVTIRSGRTSAWSGPDQSIFPAERFMEHTRYSTTRLNTAWEAMENCDLIAICGWRAAETAMRGYNLTALALPADCNAPNPWNVLIWPDFIHHDPGCIWLRGIFSEWVKIEAERVKKLAQEGKGPPGYDY